MLATSQAPATPNDPDPITGCGGAKDSDWQPVKDAAKELAFAEDKFVVDGFAPAGITGVRPSSSNSS